MTPPDVSEDRTGPESSGEMETLSQRRDRLLFDGQWLAPSEIRSHHRRLKWRSFWVVVETVAVVALLLAAAYSLYLRV